MIEKTNNNKNSGKKTDVPFKQPLIFNHRKMQVSAMPNTPLNDRV